MVNINNTQSSFSGGIISTELFSRLDFSKVLTGLKQCDNFAVRPAGGVVYRAGTKYVADAKVENWRGTYQQQEEVENLLLNEICQRNIWDKAAADKKGLAAFYAKNKKKYKWEMKRLKKMKVNLPRNGEYPDVVLADYQDSLEKQWVAQLKKKYKVVVFRSMLTTLNIH